jgi:hypothetical protein
MNSIIFNRIQEQQKHNSISKPKIVTNKPIIEPISPEKLQNELEHLFQVEQVNNSIIEKKNIQEFPDLFHFVEWYLGKESLFLEKQNEALKTLVQARDLINVGCACKRTQRIEAAHNYFKIFWANNAKTNLVSSVLQACKTESVLFGNFLHYP